MAAVRGRSRKAPKLRKFCVLVHFQKMSGQRPMKVWLPARSGEEALRALARRHEFMDRARSVVLGDEELDPLFIFTAS
jgi:hypothetical protein